MQQQTNFFTPTQKHLIQLHGFPNITDIIYVNFLPHYLLSVHQLSTVNNHLKNLIKR